MIGFLASTLALCDMVGQYCSSSDRGPRGETRVDLPLSSADEAAISALV